MRMKLIAGSGFLLNTIFFATYYAVAKEALSRIDPIVFSFFEMIALIPLALLILLCSWRQVNRVVIRRGIILGSMLCLALFTIAIALKYTTATSTAFFPALNGFLAAIIALVLFREPLKKLTWWAGALSVTGALLLIFTSAMGTWRGTLIAFLGGLFYTCYVFLCDREQKDEKALWALFGVELLTTAMWGSLIALLFGDWQAVHPALPKDIVVVLYVALACTFLPTLITVLLQKHISPVTVSFIYILEPVLGAVVANFYLNETLPVAGYLGGGLVVLGAVLHTWSTMEHRIGTPAVRQRVATQQVNGSWMSTVLYPGLCCVVGTLALLNLGGLPPTSWLTIYGLWQQMPHYIQQGQGSYIALLFVQAGGWLVAWVAVLLMGAVALTNTSRRLFWPVPSPDQPVLPARLAHSVPENPDMLPVRRVRIPSSKNGPITQPDLYNQSIWPASLSSGPETPPPYTEPLQRRRNTAQLRRLHTAYGAHERLRVGGSPYIERVDA